MVVDTRNLISPRTRVFNNRRMTHAYNTHYYRVCDTNYTNIAFAANGA